MARGSRVHRKPLQGGSGLDQPDIIRIACSFVPGRVGDPEDSGVGPDGRANRRSLFGQRPEAARQGLTRMIFFRRPLLAAATIQTDARESREWTRISEGKNGDVLVRTVHYSGSARFPYFSFAFI